MPNDRGTKNVYCRFPHCFAFLKTQPWYTRVSFLRVFFANSFSATSHKIDYPLLDHLEKNPPRDRSDKGKWCSIRYRWLNEGRKQRGEEMMMMAKQSILLTFANRRSYSTQTAETAQADMKLPRPEWKYPGHIMWPLLITRHLLDSSWRPTAVVKGHSDGEG